MAVRTLFVSLLLSLLAASRAFRLPRIFGCQQRAAAAAAILFVGVQVAPVSEALAVSGGGKDYATKNLEGDTTFAGSDNKNKDFTQVIGRSTDFSKARLQGSRFYRALLESANFDGADLTGASLEDAGLEKASFKDTVLVNAYIGSGFEKVASVEGADFTDALMPQKVQALLCARDDVNGKNSKTGAVTSESLLCP